MSEIFTTFILGFHKMVSFKGNDFVFEHEGIIPHFCFPCLPLSTAAIWADERLDAGDMDGQGVWKQILAAVDELLSEKRPEGTMVH